MPWTGKQFAAKHNHKLTGTAAKTAGKQATTLVGKGMPEGEAIAIANNTGDRLQGSPKSPADHMVRLSKHNTQTATGKALGRSQSTVSRTLRRGYTKEGGA